MKQEKTTNNAENNYDLPFLDNLVNEVATGQRIVFFPPGMLIFVFTMTPLPIFPSILLAAASIDWLGSGLSPDVQTNAPLISGPIYILFVLVPFYLIIHGKKKYVEVTRYYYRFLFLTSSIFLAYYGLTYNDLNIAFLLASTFSGLGLWLMKTPSYQLLVEYMHRLKKRKLEIYEEEQKSMQGK
ncbi:hypothetical protein MNBD_GAMMA07-161 [hydrothermal vent metagenome]|uniref:Uncharacterized protein n=1 Tax=hydrothermal vent metagenome TaxID=652676 RepID=A0A3B0WUY8_9ZZZZ